MVHYCFSRWLRARIVNDAYIVTVTDDWCLIMIRDHLDQQWSTAITDDHYPVGMTLLGWMIRVSAWACKLGVFMLPYACSYHYSRSPNPQQQCQLVIYYDGNWKQSAFAGTDDWVHWQRFIRQQSWYYHCNGLRIWCWPGAWVPSRPGL